MENKTKISSLACVVFSKQKNTAFKNTVAKKKQNTHTHINVMVILNRK